MSLIIACVSQKGGVGKSTLASTNQYADKVIQSIVERINDLTN